MPRRRKKQRPIEDFLDMLVNVPWFVGPIIAAIAFVFLRFVIPAILTSNVGQNPNVDMKAFNTPLAMFSTTLAPFAFFGVLVLWGVAELKKFIDRRRLDNQTGLDSIAHLSWREFEELIAEAFRRKGYSVDLRGGAGGDGGIDVLLRRNGQITLVQCKQWRSWKVGVKVVRELLGAMTSFGAAYGIVVAQGRFTAEAQEFADENNITLIGGDELLNMIRSVQRSKPQPLPTAQPSQMARPVASAAPAPSPAQSEHASPSCPRCGAPMTRRTARNGPNAGHDFWGCSKYPACRGIVSL